MDKIFKIIVRLLVILGLSMMVVNKIRWDKEREIRRLQPLENIYKP